MSKGRLEAFSDGVLAIIITIMVLELKIPQKADVADLLPLIPVLLSYALSFVFLGIYWNNHHHLFQAVKRVNGRVLWANLHLLFWLSLTPFVTGGWGSMNLHRGRLRCTGWSWSSPQLRILYSPGRSCRCTEKIRSWRLHSAGISKGRYRSSSICLPYRLHS
jgi:ABC-type uncharacterized transport system YnjBCD permease subunit